MLFRADTLINGTHHSGHKQRFFLLVNMIIDICGFPVIIDEEDAKRVASKSWALDKYRYKTRGKAYFRCAYYKVINNKIYRSLWLHRVILDLPSWNGLVVDHINGNTLDNRKENLRICKQNGNSKNRAINKNNSSGYKGVSWYPLTKKWKARIGVNYKRIALGYFDTPEEAYKAYCEASKKYHGEFGRIK